MPLQVHVYPVQPTPYLLQWLNVGRADAPFTSQLLDTLGYTQPSSPWVQRVFELGRYKEELTAAKALEEEAMVLADEYTEDLSRMLEEHAPNAEEEAELNLLVYLFRLARTESMRPCRLPHCPKVRAIMTKRATAMHERWETMSVTSDTKSHCSSLSDAGTVKSGLGIGVGTS